MSKDEFVELFSQPDLKISGFRDGLRTRVLKAERLKNNQVENFAADLPAQEEPQIELKKNGDFVEAIRFQCSCGRTAHVLLQYDEKERDGKKIIPGEREH